MAEKQANSLESVEAKSSVDAARHTQWVWNGAVAAVLAAPHEAHELNHHLNELTVQ